MTCNCSTRREGLAAVGKLEPMRADATLQIVLPLPLPQWFDYLPPPGHLPGVDDIGKRVRVPFGSRQMLSLIHI